MNEKSKARARLDQELLEEALRDLGSAVTGKEVPVGEGSDGEQLTDALNRILAYLHQKTLAIPVGGDPMACLRDQRTIATRTVYLEGAWYKNAIGPYLGETADGRPIALIPKRTGYVYYDSQTGKTVRLNERTASGIRARATCFYIPLPAGKLRQAESWFITLQVQSAGSWFHSNPYRSLPPSESH